MVRKVGFAVVVVVGVVAFALLFLGGSDDDGGDDRSSSPSTQLSAGMSTNDVLGADPQFEGWVGLLTSSEVRKELRDAGPHTMLAPGPTAFASMDGDLRAATTNDPTVAGAELARRHVLKGHHRFEDLLALAEDGGTVETLGGERLAVTVAEGVVSVGGVPLAKVDIETKQAVIHVVDAFVASPDAAAVTPEGDG